MALKMLMHLDNFCYRYIATFSKVVEGGVHPKHRLTEYHKFFIDNIHSGDNVLDVGCGNGYLTYDIAQKAEKVTGIDLNRKNIAAAKAKFNHSNIHYMCGDATQLVLEEVFDVIVLSNVLEHLNHRVEFLKALKDKTRVFLIRVPMINRDWLTYYKKELGIDYRLDFTHQIEYTMAAFQQEISEAGLSIKQASVQFGEIWAVVERY